MRKPREKFARMGGPLAVLLLASVPALGVACSEEGETPKCTAQVLYVITDPDARDAPAVRAARQAAENEPEGPCLTPIGTAVSSGPDGGVPAPTGGRGGTGGTMSSSAGAGGSP